MKKTILIFLSALILVFSLYVIISKNAEIIWNSDDVIKYESCEKFNKEYPCKEGGFSFPIGISGCSYVGIWIKNMNIKFPMFTTGCTI
jgi:hypothetical protein